MKWKAFWRIVLLLVITAIIVYAYIPKYKYSLYAALAWRVNLRTGAHEEYDREQGKWIKSIRDITSIPKWSEVVLDARYIGASPEEKDKVKEEWYSSNVKTDPRYKPSLDKQIRQDLFNEVPR